MQIIDDKYLGKRVRKTIHYPERSVFCPAVSYTYDGIVEKVRDVEADALAAQARRYHGEFHVTLRDVTVSPNPETPLRRTEHKASVVLLGHEFGWETV